MAKDITPKICAEIVRLLKEERERQGLSQNQLATKADVNQSLVSAIEKEPWNPTVSTLLRIAGALEIDLGKVVTVARKNVLRQANVTGSSRAVGP